MNTAITPTDLANLAPVGSETWATALRTSVKSLRGAVEDGYVRLARYLHLVATTHVDNDPSQPLIFTLWGYPTFEAWVEGDLDIHPRKARSLRFIAQRMEVDLKALPAPQKDELYGLGWTKLRELCRVLTPENAGLWTTVAVKSTNAQLNVSVKQALTTAKQKAASKTGLQIQDAEWEPAGDAVVAPAPGEVPSSVADPDLAAAIAATPPSTNEVEAFVVHLFPAQRELMEAALTRAKEVTGSDSRGHNLSLIIQSFLATTPFAKAETSRDVLVQSLADTLGLRVVLVDREIDAVVFTSE